MADALARLDACGAEAELIALARDCLAAEPEDRPRDASVVAERITAYLAGVQERVRAAERERAVAEARAVEERKRRRSSSALAASRAGAHDDGRARASSMSSGSGRPRPPRVAKVIGEASTLRDLARANPEDVARWRTARWPPCSRRRVWPAATPRPSGQLAALRVEVQAGAGRGRSATGPCSSGSSTSARPRPTTHDGSQTDAAYAAAFRDAGLDLDGPAPAEVGARIKARPPGVALALAAALDDWSAVRRSLRTTRPAPAAWPRSPAGRPRPLARRPPRRARPGRQGWPQGGVAGPRRAPRSSMTWGPSASTCWARPWPTRETRRRPRGCCVAPRLRHPATSGSTMTSPGAGAAQPRATKRSASTPPPAPSAPRRPTSWPMRWRGRGESDEAIEVFRDLARLRPRMGRHLACLGDESESAWPVQGSRRGTRTGRRRPPRGDPAQARRRHGPQQPRHSP